MEISTYESIEISRPFLNPSRKTHFRGVMVETPNGLNNGHESAYSSKNKALSDRYVAIPSFYAVSSVP